MPSALTDDQIQIRDLIRRVAKEKVAPRADAIDHASEYIKNRVAFGQEISDFQGVRWMLADMATQTEAAR